MKYKFPKPIDLPLDADFLVLFRVTIKEGKAVFSLPPNGTIIEEFEPLKEGESASLRITVNTKEAVVDIDRGAIEHRPREVPKVVQ